MYHKLENACTGETGYMIRPSCDHNAIDSAALLGWFLRTADDAADG